MRRTLIVLGSLTALACPPPAVAVPRAPRPDVSPAISTAPIRRAAPVRRPEPQRPGPPSRSDQRDPGVGAHLSPVSPPIAPPVPNVVTAPPASGPAAATRQIFKIGNDGGVMNQPTRPSVFMLDQPTLSPN